MYIVAVTQTRHQNSFAAEGAEDVLGLPVTNCFGSASASYDSTAFLKWSIDLSALKGKGDSALTGATAPLPLFQSDPEVQCPEERVGFAIVMNVGRFEQILECRGWTHPAGLE